jgi:hypothetical protein
MSYGIIEPEAFTSMMAHLKITSAEELRTGSPRRGMLLPWQPKAYSPECVEGEFSEVPLSPGSCSGTSYVEYRRYVAQCT